ncbi:MAG: hypothetical protein ACLR4A_07780 [Christensenellales bacterium]
MNQREYRIGPGAASLMLLVVVLSMSVLGMLALMSARSDENLSLRSCRGGATGRRIERFGGTLAG